MPDTGLTNWPLDTDDLNLPTDMDTRAPTSAGDGHYTFKQWMERATGMLRATAHDLLTAMTHALNMGGFKITNLGTPTTSTDASTKAYVDTRAPALTPTAVKTSNYTAAAGDFVPVDTTSGAVTVTLPTAPADGSRIGVKLVILGGSNAVTVACGGSDVYNKAAGATTLTLSLVAQAVSLQYKATGAIWYVVADDEPLSGLVALFKSNGIPPSGGVENFPRNGSTLANAGILTTAQLYLTAITLPPATVVSNISFFAATTPLSAGVDQWFALFDSSRNKLAVTADDTATAWAANSQKTLFVSRQVTDAAIASGAAVLTSVAAAFSSADVGKQVIVVGAGAAAAPLGSSASPVTILSVSGNTATLSSNAGTTIASGGTAYIATPYTTTNTAVAQFYVGIMVKATVPTLTSVVGGAGAANMNGLAPKLCGTSTGSLTDPSTCPNPAASLAAIASNAYAYVS